MDASECLPTSFEDPSRLHRLLRITEGDRRVYHRDTKLVLLRQRKVIHKLEAEKAEIESKVEEGRWSAVQPQDSYIAKLFTTYKAARREDHEMRMVVQDQKLELGSLEKGIDRLRLGTVPSDSGHVSMAKKIEVLEDRLETTSSNLNRLLYNNGQLRAIVENMLKQKSVHRQIVRELQKNLSANKNQIEMLINDAVENYNARDDNHQRLRVLKEEHQLDGHLCRSQLQEAKRLLHLQKQLIAFVATKNRNRNVRTLESPSSAPPSSAVYKLTVTAQPVTDKDDDDLLFTYASELNNKAEAFQNSLLHLREQLECLEANVVTTETLEVSSNCTLESELLQSRQKHEKANSETACLRKTYQKLKSGIRGMLQMISSNDSNITSLKVCDDNDDDVEKVTIMKSIKAIEHEIDELLKMRKFMGDRFSKELAVMSPSFVAKRSSAIPGSLQSVNWMRCAIYVSSHSQDEETTSEVNDESLKSLLQLQSSKFVCHQ